MASFAPISLWNGNPSRTGSKNRADVLTEALAHLLMLHPCEFKITYRYSLPTRPKGMEPLRLIGAMAVVIDSFHV